MVTMNTRTRHNVASNMGRLILVCKELGKVTLHVETVILMYMKCDLDYTLSAKLYNKDSILK
jgi:hypothetical protein